MTEPALPDKITAVHGRLEGEGIAHAFGGAFALAYYAEPRTTIDIDVNVFVPPARFPAVLAAFAGLGVESRVDPDTVERDGQCRLLWGRTPLDLFFSYDPLHEAMRRDRRTVPFDGVELPILAPEHLIVCKVAFDRPKDWLDIEQMLVCVERLDIASIDEHLNRLLGDDPRRERFDRLASRAVADR